MSIALSKEELYLKSIEDEARTGIKSLALLAVVLFPIFSILDYFTQKPDLVILTIIRYSTSFIFLCTYILFRKGYGLRKPIHTSNILLGTASLSITLMCMVLQGSAAPYYAGVNLVVLAGVLILPTNAKEMTKTVSIIIGIYILGIIAIEGLTIHSMPTFVNNLSFLIGTGVIGVFAAYYKYKIRKEAFIQNLEVKRSVELLQRDLKGQGTDIEGLTQKMVEKKDEAQSAVKVRDGFISMASHELRTPLTSMKLQMDVAMIKLKGGDTDHDNILKHISTAYRQINNILRLVDEMLDVSRIQSGKFVLEKGSLKLNDLVSGILLRYYSDQISAGTLNHISSADTLRGSWDGFKLEQVIVNLINNAFRYGDGKQVKIETGKIGEEAWVSVSNKGAGIPLGEQAKIFDKFERGVSAKSGGLGLGLFISKEIVDAHGGRIELKSEPDKETVFKVFLPLK